MMLLVGLVFFYSAERVYGEARASISQQYNNLEDDGTPVDTYYADEPRVYNVHVDLSAASGSETYSVKLELDDVYMKGHDLDGAASLAAFKAHVKIPKPQSASDVRYVREGGQWVVYIDFKELTGGLSFSIPVVYHFGQSRSHDEGFIPDGYEHTVRASVVTASGVVIKEAESLSFYTKYSKPNMWISVDKATSFLGFVDEDGAFIPGTGNQHVKFSFYDNVDDGSLRFRDFSHYVITNPLPDGATFNPDLTINGHLVNAGWVLSEDGKSVSLTSDTHVGHSLYLTFTDKEHGDIVTNEASMRFYVNNPAPYEAAYKEASNVVNVTFTVHPIGNILDKDGSTSNGQPDIINDSLVDRTRGESWVLRVVNPAGGTTLKNAVLSDTKKADGSPAMDERLYVRKIQYANNYTRNYIDKIVFYMPDGSTVTKTPRGHEVRDDDVSDRRMILGPQGNVGFDVYYKDIPPNTSLSIQAFGAFKDPNRSHFDKDVPKNNQLWNESTLSFDMVVNGVQVGDRRTISDRDFLQLVPFEEYVWFYTDEPVSDYHVLGDTLPLTFKMGAELESHKSLTDMTAVILLPDGMDVGDPSTFRGEAVTSFTVEYNYKGTGRAAVLAKMNDVTGHLSGQWLETSFTIYGTVNNLSDNGINIVDAYLTFNELDDDNLVFYSEYIKEDGNWYLGSLTDDTLGINKPSIQTDQIMYSKLYYRYASIKELTIDKYVKTDAQDTWDRQGAYGKEKDAVTYNLEIVNQLDEDVRSVVFYDVLPHVGDTHIVGSNNGGKTPRESAFRPVLSGEVKAPDGFTVYYSTDEQPDNVRDAMADRYWTTARGIDDYADVTAIKIEMNAGRTIENKERIRVEIPMVIPEGVRAGERAYNSYAVSTDGGRTFTESNKVYVEAFETVDIPVRKHWIGGSAASATIKLHADGFVRDSVRLTEADDWSHLFKDMPKHDAVGNVIHYTVSENEVPGYTTSITGDVEKGFDVTNSAVYRIQVDKVWDSEPPVDGVDVTLYGNGKSVATGRITEADGWSYTFGPVPTVDDAGEPVTYTIAETPVPGYVTTIAGSPIDGFTITNAKQLAIGVDAIEIFTGRAVEGLKVRLDMRSQYNGSVTDAKYANETVTIALIETDGEKRRVLEKTVKISDLQRVIEMAIPPTYLSVDTVRNYQAEIVGFSHPIFRPSDASSIDTDGHTTSELVLSVAAGSLTGDDENGRISYHGDYFEYIDVVKTMRSVGEPIVKFRETIRFTTMSVGRMKTGYGVEVNRDVLYSNPIAAQFDGLDAKLNPRVMIQYDAKLVDDKDQEVVVIEDGLAKKETIEVVNETTMDEALTKHIQVRPPQVYVSPKSGILHSHNPDEALYDGGTKLYVPMWLQDLGYYDVNTVTTNRTGIHRIHVTITDQLDVYAYMFAHVDSATMDKDELLVRPATKFHDW